MKLWIHPLALDELDEAAAWYDAREPGLGDELVLEVQDGLRWIEERPLAWPLLADGLRYRVFNLRRFPYQLPFSVEQDRANVWAVAHTRRRDGYWRERG
ncbi:MAG: type II toxin-antitoxin system RelE/ParE family toxin [Deltaproteobacteria bacterium]|nr:type II toxin-antitoxin system RelE/ParE family toxin [Deltaproteobacteria bacterium]